MIHVQDKILPVKRLAGKEVSKDYPGVDNWQKCCPSKKGQYCLHCIHMGRQVWLLPLGINFVRGYAVRSGRGNARAFNDSV